VAAFTLSYLVPVFGQAFLSLINLIGGEVTRRQLFESGTGYVAPLAERIVAIGSVVLLLLALPFGLRQVWRRYLHHPVMLLLSGAALAYFSTLGLRLVPSAWEIGNRASEFLFIGLALITALARFPKLSKAQLGEWLTRTWMGLSGLQSNLTTRGAFAGQAAALLPAPGTSAADESIHFPVERALQVRTGGRTGRRARRRSDWAGRLALAFAALAIFSGGVIAGWLPQLRLALLLRLQVDGQVLEPAGLAAARWMFAEHGSGNTLAADESNGRTLLANGWQHIVAGRFPNIVSILETDRLADWQWEMLRTLGINYMLIDRRKISANNMLGYFFDRGHSGPAASEWPPEVYLKFDRIPLISRELDSGDIVIYNFREFIRGTAQP
jgi:hypothetical protein